MITGSTITKFKHKGDPHSIADTLRLFLDDHFVICGSSVCHGKTKGCVFIDFTITDIIRNQRVGEIEAEAAMGENGFREEYSVQANIPNIQTFEFYVGTNDFTSQKVSF